MFLLLFDCKNVGDIISIHNSYYSNIRMLYFHPNNERFFFSIDNFSNLFCITKLLIDRKNINCRKFHSKIDVSRWSAYNLKSVSSKANILIINATYFTFQIAFNVHITLE